MVNLGSILKQEMKHQIQRSLKSSPNVAVGISFVLDYACPLDVTIESIPTLGVCTTMDTLVDFEAYPLVIIVVDVHPSLDRESSVPHPMIVVASSCSTNVFPKEILALRTWCLEVRCCHDSSRPINV